MKADYKWPICKYPFIFIQDETGAGNPHKVVPYLKNPTVTLLEHVVIINDHP